MHVSLVVVLVCLAISSSYAQKVGVKATVSSGGLSYLKDIGIELLEGELSSLSIPDITGKASTPIGSISYDLTDIKITSLTIPGSGITLVPPSGVSLDVTDTEATMTLNWHYREDDWPHVSDSGSADIKVSSTTMDIEMTVGESKGRPTATTSSCKVNIGSLDIDLHGGASWLYNLFVGMFSDQIKSATEGQLESAIPSAVNSGLAGALSTLPIVEPINSEIELDYEMESAPYINPNYFSLNSLGEFYLIKNSKEFPSSPATMPDTATSEMVQIFVSDFTFNSAAYCFFEANELRATITDKELPSNAPLRLNTTYFSEMIPPLYKAYPNQMFNLYVYALQVPTAQFTSQGAFVTTIGAIDVVILPKQDIAFTLGVKVLSAGVANVNANRNTVNVTGDLSFLNATLALLNTSIGQFNVSALQQIVDVLVTAMVIPEVNKILEAGFPLPSITGLTFLKPTVGWGDRYLYVSSNVNYVPPKKKSNLEDDSAPNIPVKLV